MEIYENTTVEFKRKVNEVRTIIIPVGSFEQHSAHMCLGTDFLTANAIAKKVACETNTIALPPIIYGVSEVHKQFSGTMYIKPKHFYYYVHDIAESILKENVDNILFVNGHGANWFAVNKVCEDFKESFKHIEVFQWWELIGEKYFTEEEGSHAGAQELSVLTAIHPECTRLDKVENQKVHRNVSLLECQDLYELSYNGVLGTADTYDVEKGKAAFEEVVSKFCTIIQEWESEC